MTRSGVEPPKDRRWLTIILATWLGGLVAGFGVAYVVWTALTPPTNGHVAAERPPSETAPRQ
jgi:hypothetical protein